MIRIFLEIFKTRLLIIDKTNFNKQDRTWREENNKNVSEQLVTDKSITRKKRREKITRKKKTFSLNNSMHIHSTTVFSYIPP